MRRRIVIVHRCIGEIPIASDTFNQSPRLSESLGYSNAAAERSEDAKIRRETFTNTTKRRKTRQKPRYRHYTHEEFI